MLCVPCTFPQAVRLPFIVPLRGKFAGPFAHQLLLGGQYVYAD